MRTTVSLDEDVLSEAKVLAQKSGQTLSNWIQDTVRERLARRAANPEFDRVILPTSGGGGVLPGVDLDNTASLLDTMDALD